MKARDSFLPLAHSAKDSSDRGDPYDRHIGAVLEGARRRAAEMLQFTEERASTILAAITDAAAFHDLGKLDDENQSALRKGRGYRLPWDHIDAGVAHLSTYRCHMSAWLVRGHHAPGLPCKSEHFADALCRRLRGRRYDDRSKVTREEHRQQRDHTDRYLAAYVEEHNRLVPSNVTPDRCVMHGLTMRLALSCLVDADHADTASFDGGTILTSTLQPRWDERLESLCGFVDSLGGGVTAAERERNERRRLFFDTCLNSHLDEFMVACQAPVGLGKTTSVTAYLIRRARDARLRRLLIVAPYTSILSQTASVLRKALTLPGEDPNEVVVEHHHRADFENANERQLAALWQAPVVLTTAVSFFETLSACKPATLRKLHAIPGSAIFIDEAHAALPTKLWPQNFRWLRKLASQWKCPIVFASGSLAQFWEESTGIMPEGCSLPEILPYDQACDILQAESARVRYRQLGGGSIFSVNALVETVDQYPGPRLIILNTVQNAALVAHTMRKAGLDVLHLSTALTPRDRTATLKKVRERLSTDRDWSLVATSCVEAGVDFSFRVGFRERFSVSSLFQVGGRVNRHGEYDEVGEVYDFVLGGAGVSTHPDAGISAQILREFMKKNKLNKASPSEIVTEAMRLEFTRRGGASLDDLWIAEDKRNYPLVAELGRVISADTRIVVVDVNLRNRIRQGEKVSFRELLQGSVQLWANRVAELALQPLYPNGDRYAGRDDVLYVWEGRYDPNFLGYMEDVLNIQSFVSGEACIV